MRKLIAAVLVLAGLALLVDFGSAAYAEYRVSRELRTALSLQADPDVRINGFPFLTQAADGRYRSVDVSATGVPVPGFGAITVEATLRGIRLPAADALAGRVDGVVADSVDARVRIGATDLGRHLGVPDLEVSTPPLPDDAPEGTVQTAVVLTGTVDVLGVRERVSVDAAVSLGAGGALVLTATGLDLGADGAGSLTESVVSAVLARFSVTIDPSAVPFDVVPTEVRAEGSDLVVAGTGTDVAITGGTPTP